MRSYKEFDLRQLIRWDSYPYDDYHKKIEIYEELERCIKERNRQIKKLRFCKKQKRKEYVMYLTRYILVLYTDLFNFFQSHQLDQQAQSLLRQE